ncbi:hypothetical protein LTR65_008935 [Meristemomyces frigidus]
MPQGRSQPRYSSPEEAIEASLAGQTVTKADLEVHGYRFSDDGTVVEENGGLVAIVQLLPRSIRVLDVNIEYILSGSVQADGAVINASGQFRGRLLYEQASDDLAGFLLSTNGLILSNRGSPVGWIFSALLPADQWRKLGRRERAESSVQYTLDRGVLDYVDKPGGYHQGLQEATHDNTLKKITWVLDHHEADDRNRTTELPSSSASGGSSGTGRGQKPSEPAPDQSRAVPQDNTDARKKTRQTREPNHLYDPEPDLISRARKVRSVLRRVQDQIHDWANWPSGSPIPEELTTDSDKMREVRFDLFYTVFFLSTLSQDKHISRRQLPHGIFTDAACIVTRLIGMMVDLDQATAHFPDRINFRDHLVAYAKEIQRKLAEINEQLELPPVPEAQTRCFYETRGKRKEQPASPRPVEARKRLHLDGARKAEQRHTPHIAGNNKATNSGSPMSIDAYNLKEGSNGWVSYGPLPSPGSPLDTPQRLDMMFEMNQNDATTPEEHAWLSGQLELLQELEEEFRMLGERGNRLMTDPPQQLHLFTVRHRELAEAIETKVLDKLRGTAPYNDWALEEAKSELDERVSTQLTQFHLCLQRANSVWELDGNFSAIIYGNEDLPFPEAIRARNRKASGLHTQESTNAAGRSRMDIDPGSADQIASRELDDIERFGVSLVEREAVHMSQRSMKPEVLLARQQRLQRQMERGVLDKLRHLGSHHSEATQRRAERLFESFQSRLVDVQAIGKATRPGVHVQPPPVPDINEQVGGEPVNPTSQSVGPECPVSNSAAAEPVSVAPEPADDHAVKDDATMPPDANGVRAAQAAQLSKEVWADKIMDDARKRLQELEPECSRFLASAPTDQPPPLKHDVDFEYNRLTLCIKLAVLIPVEKLMQHENETVRQRSSKLAEHVKQALKLWEEEALRAVLERLRLCKIEMLERIQKGERQASDLQLSAEQADKYYEALFFELGDGTYSEVSAIGEQHGDEEVKAQAKSILEELQAWVYTMRQWLEQRKVQDRGNRRMGDHINRQEEHHEEERIFDDRSRETGERPRTRQHRNGDTDRRKPPEGSGQDQGYQTDNKASRQRQPPRNEVHFAEPAGRNSRQDRGYQSEGGPSRPRQQTPRTNNEAVTGRGECWDDRGYQSEGPPSRRRDNRRQERYDPESDYDDDWEHDRQGARSRKGRAADRAKRPSDRSERRDYSEGNRGGRTDGASGRGKGGAERGSGSGRGQGRNSRADERRSNGHEEREEHGRRGERGEREDRQGRNPRGGRGQRGSRDGRPRRDRSTRGGGRTTKPRAPEPDQAGPSQQPEHDTDEVL